MAIDPLSLINHVCVGWCHYVARRFDQAIVQIRSCLEMEPRFLAGYPTIARAHLMKRMPREALAELERGMSFLGRVPVLLTYAAWAHAALGARSEAIGILEELRHVATLRYVPSIYAALILGALGELDEAFGVFDLAYEQRSGWLVFIGNDPIWDYLRSDPRFVALVNKMRLNV